MAESTSTPTPIPDKSRSLRKTSVKKRLETEVKRKEPKSMKDRLSKKARLSKYRRKSANAKERERMKRQNDVFEVLKEILPCDKAKRSDEEKETKVNGSIVKSLLQIIFVSQKMYNLTKISGDNFEVRDCLHKLLAIST